MFATAYLPLLGATVAAMLAPPDGGKRVLIFIVLAICSDIGGYFAGITLTPFTGGHKMAPVISPKKTWEGLAGSAFLCVVAGAVMLPTMLHGHWWQGVITGIAALAAAVFGDLAESMIKRDLAIKDMGTLLPGHGGILDRIDSLLACAPVVWLLLAALFVRASKSATSHVGRPAPGCASAPPPRSTAPPRSAARGQSRNVSAAGPPLRSAPAAHARPDWLTGAAQLVAPGTPYARSPPSYINDYLLF